MVTQNGQPLRAGPPAGRLVRCRARLVGIRMIKPARGGLRVDLGAGRVPAFKKLGKRKAVPAAIAGTYVSSTRLRRGAIKRNGRWRQDRRCERPADQRRPGLDDSRASMPTPSRSRRLRQLASTSPSSPISMRDKAGQSRRPRGLDRPHQEDAVRAESSQPAQRNGIAYIRPPLIHSAFWPRSSLSGVFLPTLRSKLSP
mgnify:CR=1 FL=1